jgi:hypothetical protein
VKAPTAEQAVELAILEHAMPPTARVIRVVADNRFTRYIIGRIAVEEE